MDYCFYTVDVETTGLDPVLYDVIEVSIQRLADGEQKTWYMQPTNPNNYEEVALRINGHKLEDLRHETAEGRKKYMDPKKAIIEIENWLLDDGSPTQLRACVGQNISFDIEMLKRLWKKCGSEDTFPFGRRYLDTMVIEMFMDFCKDGALSDNNKYNLGSIIKKYGVKNEKAHTADADVRATTALFQAQVAKLQKLMKLLGTQEG